MQQGVLRSAASRSRFVALLRFCLLFHCVLHWACRNGASGSRGEHRGLGLHGERRFARGLHPAREVARRGKAAGHVRVGGEAPSGAPGPGRVRGGLTTLSRREKGLPASRLARSLLWRP